LQGLFYSYSGALSRLSVRRSVLVIFRVLMYHLAKVLNRSTGSLSRPTSMSCTAVDAP